MGKATKATKKLDIQSIKKQRRTINKYKKVEDKKLKTLTSRRNKRGEAEVEDDEEKVIKKNLNIVAGEEEEDIDLENYQDDEDEEEVLDQEEEEEEEDEADEDDDKQLFSEKEKKLMKSKEKPDTEAKESESVKSLKGQIAKHREDLEKLKSQDPELFKFLGDNESGLLDFGADASEDDEDEDDDLEDDDEDEDDDIEEDSKDKSKKKEKKQKKQKQEKVQEVLTSALLDTWYSECEKQVNLKSLKKLLLAFKSACHTGMPGSTHTQKKNVQDDREEDSISGRDVPFKIIHSAVFNRTLIICLQNIPKYIDSLLDYDSTKDFESTNGQRPKLPNTCEKWSILFPVIRTYIKNLIYLIGQLSDPSMILVSLKGLDKVICYLACFLPSSKLTLDSLLQHWQSSNESVRILSFLCIRKMAIFTPYPFIDECLKRVYLTYVRNSKFVSTTSLPIINFMCNCVVEIFGLDFASSYRHAFVYIRQLAIHLRNTLNKLTKESIQNIYNWLYINGLRAWVELLCAHPQQEQLKLLHYPITQLLIGVIGLTNSGKFFPLRFHCIRMLNRLAETNQIFINTTPYLLELLSTKDFTSEGGATASKNKEINFLTALSVQDAYLNTRSFREGSRDQFTLLLVENLNIFSCHIGFPELSVPVLIHLKKYIKSIKNVKTIKQIKEIIEAINKQSRTIKNKRDQVRFSPKETKQVANFTTQLKEQLGPNGNPITVILTALKKKSQLQQEMFLQSTKEYDYEDEQEEEEEGEDQDDEDMEEIGDEDDEDMDDDEGELYDEEDMVDEEEEVDEEEQTRPAKKTKSNKKKPSKKVLNESTADDVVEDLDLSDDE